MKKIQLLFALAITLLAGTNTFAQYEKGDKLLNVGVGLSSYYGGGLPIGASFEVGVTDEISVGAQVDYYSWSYNGYLGGYDYRYTFLPVAVRGSYHVNKLLNLNQEKLDLYGGLALGYYISKYTYDGPGGSSVFNNSYGNRVLFGLHLGARYYFKPKVGAFAEVGYGVSALKLGIAFKF